MIIKKLTGLQVSNVVATVVKRGDKNYFNITHGSYGKNFHQWWCGLSTIFFKKPENHGETLKLEDNNYLLKPIYKNNKKQIDKNGNQCYMLILDNMDYHKDDVLVFWEIPNKNYKDITYNIEGEHAVIGQGEIGKERNNTIYKSPCPIIEIYGDVTLSWKGKNSNNQNISQTIKYNYLDKKWTIDVIKIDEKE